jgi:DNA (cytosine-5)-methyltransferase 1
MSRHGENGTTKKPGQAGLPFERKQRAVNRLGLEPRGLRVVGLFAGIGGIELGLSRSGHETLLLCENDQGASAVLRQHFPEVRLHDDVRSLEGLPRGTQLVTAGFPCQDLSQAGKTAGITGARSGLVGEVFRLLKTRPIPWVLLENVPFMLQLGRGRALDVVVQALERLGYSWAYRVVDARAFGLPQRRQRVFLLASLDGDPRNVLLADDAGPPMVHRMNGSTACGFYWTEGIRGLGWAVDAVPTLKGGSTVGIPSAPAILMPDGRIITPDIRDAERMQGFPKDWTKPAEAIVRRGMRWKLVGNAVSVPVAKWLGERLAIPATYEPDKSKPLQKGTPWPQVAWNAGKGRFTADVSAWPKHTKQVPLREFLIEEGNPLSARATEGFFNRARYKSSLRFPDGFLSKVESHLKFMRAKAKRDLANHAGER